MDNQRSSHRTEEDQSRVDVKSTITSFFKISKSRDKKKNTTAYEKSGTSRFNVDYSKPYSFQIGCKSIPNIQNGRSYAGSNKLLNRYRKVNFYLFDMSTWEICTNNPRFYKDYNKKKKDVFSSSAKPNVRFKISSLLSQFFYNQDYIPNRIRNKYFNRIRDLLMVQYQAIENRLNKENNIDEVKSKSHQNRRTNTYIRFSYRQRTCYLGIFKRCSEEKCPLPCAYVMSENRMKCPDHVYKLYQKINEVNSPNGKQKTINDHHYKLDKFIECKRMGIKYTKVPLKVDTHEYDLITEANGYNDSTFEDLRFEKYMNYERIRPTTKKQDERLNRFLHKNKNIEKKKFSNKEMDNILQKKMIYWSTKQHHTSNVKTMDSLKKVFEDARSNRKYGSIQEKRAAKRKRRKGLTKEEKAERKAIYEEVRKQNITRKNKELNAKRKKEKEDRRRAAEKMNDVAVDTATAAHI